jgi:heme-degrading monooxygenase HmoA
MAILMIAEVEGQTPEKYDAMLAQMGEPMRKAKGFISHLAGPTEDGGWRVIEVWETKEDATRWFAEAVHPHLPPGVKPRRAFHEVHALVAR